MEQEPGGGAVGNPPAGHAEGPHSADAQGVGLGSGSSELACPRQDRGLLRRDPGVG